MNRKLMTAALALALGLAWTASPAMAQSTTEKIKDKAETAKDKVEDKARDVKDTIKEKASDVKDKVESKTHRDKDKAADKGESTMDKAKDKAADVKDKVKDKMHRMTTKGPSADVTAMQTALKDKGFDPGPIDGRMGPRTKTALRDYQKKEGLNATGRWDEETGNRLGVRMSKTTPADTMHRSTATTGSTDASASPGTSQPPAVPQEDRTAPPAKRNAP